MYIHIYIYIYIGLSLSLSLLDMLGELSTQHSGGWGLRLGLGCGPEEGRD